MFFAELVYSSFLSGINKMLSPKKKKINNDEWFEQKKKRDEVMKRYNELHRSYWWYWKQKQKYHFYNEKEFERIKKELMEEREKMIKLGYKIN